MHKIRPPTFACLARIQLAFCATLPTFLLATLAIAPLTGTHTTVIILVRPSPSQIHPTALTAMCPAAFALILRPLALPVGLDIS